MGAYRFVIGFNNEELSVTSISVFDLFNTENHLVDYLLKLDYIDFNKINLYEKDKTFVLFSKDWQ